MKTKSFAMLAVLLTAIASVAPAMAEDSSTEMPMEQTLADNSQSLADNGGPTLADNSGGASMQPPSDNSGSMPVPADNSPDMSMGNVGGMPNTPPSSTTNNDEGTPDTATGDDDY